MFDDENYMSVEQWHLFTIATNYCTFGSLIRSTCDYSDTTGGESWPCAVLTSTFQGAVHLRWVPDR